MSERIMGDGASRVKRVLLSPEFALMTLRGIERPFTTDLPADAELIEMRIEPSAVYHPGIKAQSLIALLIRSDSFESVEAGAQIPELMVICTVRCNESTQGIGESSRA